MLDVADLTRTECERLLRTGICGRIAVSTPDGPHVVPVNHSVVDDAIIVRTAPSSLLGTYGPASMLAFEVDQFDHERRRGWSVLAKGRGEVVDDPEELSHIRSTWEPRPWVAGARTLHIRVRWTALTGRRIGGAQDLFAGLPVHRSL